MFSAIVLDAKEYVSDKLKPLDEKGFKFHNLEHTLEVFDRACYLMKKEGISNDFCELLQMAVLFHDTGFLISAEGHESIGIELFDQYFAGNENLFLKDRLHFYDFVDDYFVKITGEYSQARIDIIKQLILATIPSRNPSNKLEGLIKDSDIDNLGRDDFFEKTENLRSEMQILRGKIFTDKERYGNVLNFLHGVRFYTNTQILERNGKLHENIVLVKEKLLQMN